MRNLYSLTLLLLVCTSLTVHAQLPAYRYNKYFNHYRGTYAFDMKITRDKGLIIVGLDTPSTSYVQNPLVKAGTRVGGSISIIKLDSAGNTIFDRGYFQYYFPNDTATVFGFSGVAEGQDGGLVAAGYAGLNTSTHPKDSVSCLVTGYRANGDQKWRRVVGGSGADRALAVAVGKDGNYLMAGVTTSNNIDVSGNHQTGTSDVWLVKMDTTGKVLWQKCYGGTGWDTAHAVAATPDGGFLLAGSSTSADGDVSANKGATDAWVFKIDANGNLLWQKSFGGAGADAFKSIALTPDGGYALSGYTSSADAASNGLHGGADLWVVKLDASGNMSFSKTFGGSSNEYATSIQYTVSGTLLAGGFTTSTDGDVKGQHGGADAWMVNLSATGDLLWQLCTGTAKDEYAQTTLMLSENSVVLAGSGIPSSATNLQGWVYAYGNGNHIAGTVFLDANHNSKWDPDEQPVDQVMLHLQEPNGARSVIPYRGNFMLDVDTGTYTMNIVSPLPYYNFNPSSRQLIFSSYGNTDSMNFALQPIPGIHDLQLTFTPHTSTANLFRPTTYDVHVFNHGTDTARNVTVTFVRDKREYLTSYDPAPNFTIGYTDTFTLMVPVVYPMTIAYAGLALQTDFNATFGDTITTKAWINQTVADRTPSDDSVTVRLRVTSSYDPNAKLENNGGPVLLKDLQKGQYLNYNVFFQNTGTDTAWDVRINDTLDQRLDLSTLEIVGSSAAYQLSIVGNKLSWLFKDINLVDSNRNEPLSHGYISYRVRPLSTIAAGDKVLNTASIIFDYNLPVVTNTVQTLVTDPKPPLPTLPVISGLAAHYCAVGGVGKVYIENVPSPDYQASVAATVDGKAAVVGSDSSVLIRPDTLARGAHVLRVIFSNVSGADTLKASFIVDSASRPVVHVNANVTTVTNLQAPVIVTATSTGGGGNPLYTFGKDRSFAAVYQAEGPLPALNLDASTLVVGDNKVYVRLRTSDTCYVAQTAVDSIVITRSMVTGIVDIDNPGQVINVTPNPFRSMIRVSGLLPEKDYSISLIGGNGQIVVRKHVTGQSEMTINLGALAKGIYLLRVYDEKKGRLIGSEKLLSVGQ